MNNLDKLIAASPDRKLAEVCEVYKETGEYIAMRCAQLLSGDYKASGLQWQQVIKDMFFTLKEAETRANEIAGQPVDIAIREDV